MSAKTFVIQFVNKFVEDDTSTLAASLAFYTSFSLAPLLVLFLSISARLGTDLQQELIKQVQNFAGPEAAKTVTIVIHGAVSEPRLTSLAGILSLITLLISAGLIFGQLRSTLNRVLSIKLPDSPAESVPHMLLSYLRGKFFHALAAVGFILLMIISVLVSTFVPMENLVVNSFVSALVYIAVFSFIFHFIPDRRMPWFMALEGGAITAILFVIGKVLIGLYLGTAAVGSAYGAAGSLVVFLAWVYYSSLITFVGAQVSLLLGNNSPHVETGAH